MLQAEQPIIEMMPLVNLVALFILYRPVGVLVRRCVGLLDEGNYLVHYIAVRWIDCSSYALNERGPFQPPAVVECTPCRFLK
jgi:hypothetical protein